MAPSGPLEEVRYVSSHSPKNWVFFGETRSFFFDAYQVIVDLTPVLVYFTLLILELLENKGPRHCIQKKLN